MSAHSDATDESQSESTSNLAWFLTGAIIGATAALLYAPSGKDTRQYIADKTQRGKAVDRRRQCGKPAARCSTGAANSSDAADLFDRGRKWSKAKAEPDHPPAPAWAISKSLWFATPSTGGMARHVQRRSQNPVSRKTPVDE
jgi:gas vesicle protein